ncbi:MAG: phosphatidylserine decarboxylase family protein [Flavobacteriales bacterium]|nr:phosphatidylserine decarboxylase family protein [Flavobacteriales bacterium]
MKLHREGTPTILLTLLVTLILSSLSYLYLPPILFYILAAALAVVVVIVVRFFRVPNRPPAADENLILSPCDGKVVVIEEVEETEYFKGKRKQISVFMSPLNVHINWYPIAGRVAYQKYFPGKYLVAWHPKSSTENERVTVVVEKEDGRAILFRQIAGALARRIVCYAKVDDKATQAGEMGFIKFGSRLDVFVPVDADIKVKIGDVVQGRQTPLAAWASTQR